MLFKKSILDNGVTVLSEQMDSLRSTSIGIWIAAGSRHEKPNEAGLAHYIEHTTFKGTPTRTPLKIAQEIESVGGILNAMTDKEICCFYCKVLGTHLSKAVNLLSDIVLNSSYPEVELEKEKHVILEEINMYEDEPDEVAVDKLTDGLWPNSSLGRPTIGFKETVSSFTPTEIRNYRNNHYTPANIIISAAGDIDHQTLLDMVNNIFSSYPFPKKGAREETLPQTHYPSIKTEKPVEQIHFCIGTESFARNHKDRYVLNILSTILGGGMSSRLFQEVREKLGLVYGIGTYGQSFHDTGIFGIMGGTSPEYYPQVIQIIHRELDKICSEKVSENELQDAKEQLKGRIVLGLESTNSRMVRVAEQEIYFKQYITIDDMMTRIDAVSREDIQRVAQLLLTPEKIAESIVGPVNRIKYAEK